VSDPGVSTRATAAAHNTETPVATIDRGIPSATACDILLVEDHADTQAILFHLLTAAGCRVSLADNGQQALDLLYGGMRPAVVVVDLLLPRVSGRELIAILQSDRTLREIPIVVITASPRDGVHVVADAVFEKPLDYDRLIATVRRLAARPPGV
jgi:CheY-like chemotaxis protein